MNENIGQTLKNCDKELISDSCFRRRYYLLVSDTELLVKILPTNSSIRNAAYSKPDSNSGIRNPLPNPIPVTENFDELSGSRLASAVIK